MRSRRAEPRAVRRRRRSGTVSEQQRLSIVVTEMLKLATVSDPATRAAARQVLTQLVADPLLADEDRRIGVLVLR